MELPVPILNQLKSKTSDPLNCTHFYSSCLTKYIHLATGFATTVLHTIIYSTHEDRNKDIQDFSTA